MYNMRSNPIPLSRTLWPYRTMRTSNASPLLSKVTNVDENEVSIMS